MARGHSLLVLGGARSGKSRYAEDRIEALKRDQVYIATAEPGDAEMRQRIRTHQDRRSDRWLTIESPLDLVGALHSATGANKAVLVDCITIWISNLMAHGEDVAMRVEQLAELIPDLSGTTVFVSNEVGMGIVPENALARAFRDEAGLSNQMLAAACSEVVFVAAGLPLKLKG